MANGVSGLDKLYRSLLITKFFGKGWGSPDNMRRLLLFRKVLSNRETCMAMVDKNHPVHIEKEYISSDCRIVEGYLISPFVDNLPGVMPKSVEKAQFQMVLPVKWNSSLKPVCIQLAGTGDHGFWRRRTLMARPLVKESNIGSIILENPYYGCRKPKGQLRSSLQNVSDLFVMGGALVLESIALLHWCQRMGFGPLGITGVSMGGHMASAAACSWLGPISLVPLLSWSTASQCFTQGVLSGAVSWDRLHYQYSKDNVYGKELSQLIHSPEQHRWQNQFEIGQKFAQDFPQSVTNIKIMQEECKNKNNLPVIGGLVNKISSKLAASSSITASQEVLKRMDLHSPNLPNNKVLLAEVVHFMRGVMDECTHLGHFSKPVDPGLTIVVTAQQDAYVPRDKVMSLEELWPGCEVRYIDRGHVSAFLFKQNVFRKAITDSFARQIEKYYSVESDQNHMHKDESQL